MFLQRVHATIIFKELLELADKTSFSGHCAEEVLCLVKAFNDVALLEIQKRPSFGSKRFEGSILKIWELARTSSKTTNITDLRNWRTVMATCNAVYEAIITTRSICLKRAA